jgi:ribosomal protein L18
MIDEKQQRKEEKIKQKKLKKIMRRKKKNALVICRSGKQYWTTQAQFWQWVREKVVIRTGHNPLQGVFVRKDEEKAVVISNTILNLAHPNHLSEAIFSRKYKTN